MMKPLAANRQFQQWLFPALVAIVMLLLWQFLVTIFNVPAFLVPSPLVVVQSLAQNFPSLFMSLLYTMKITVISFAVAIVIGSVIAFLLVQNRFIETALFPYIVFLQVTPIVAIAPLIII